MAEPKDRELDAILKLVKLTQDGKLTWNATQPWGELVNTESRRIESVFSCEHEGRRLRIYVEKERVDRPTGFGALISNNVIAGLGTTAPTYPYWTTKTVLEITDVEGRNLWRFPSKPAVNDLLTAVKYHVAGVKEFLDKLLADNEKESPTTT